MWYCVVLTGGATNGKHIKRIVARQHHTRGGQSDELEGDERSGDFQLRIQARHENRNRNVN